MANAQDIKALRETTGAGMMDCKKALDEAGGDKDAAEKLLKERGLAAMAKRSDRATAEGVIAVKRSGNRIAMVELVCETDFVAKNDDFVNAAKRLCELTLQKGNEEVSDEHKAIVTDAATKFRENMSCRRVALIEVGEGNVAATYIHSDGKIGAVVEVKGSTDERALEFATGCCMTLAGYTPQFIRKEDVPQSYLDEQKEILQKQMEQDEAIAKKPQKVKDGILNGKIAKHLAEVCFVDQSFVPDDKFTVTKKLEEVSKEVGAKLEFGTIKMYVLGKGE